MMTVEDVKKASIDSLEKCFEDGSWESFPDESKRELLCRVADYRVRSSGEWDIPIEESFNTPKVKKMIEEGFFDE